MDRQMDRPTVLKTDRPIDKWMGGWSDGRTDRPMDRLTKRG